MRKKLLMLWSFVALTAAAAPIPGEIAHYPMREGSGTEIKEVNNRFAPGKIRKSFWTLRDTLPLVDFGGMKTSREAYIQMPQIDFDGEFTIAIWINAYWWNPNWAGIVYRSDNTYGLRGNISCPGQLHFRVKDPDVKRGSNLMSNRVLERNRWYHVAAVYKPGKYMKLYIDGKLDSQMVEKVPAKIGKDKNAFRVGGTGKNSHFCGTMTDLHFFNRAIDEKEVWQLYKSENRFIVDTGDEEKIAPVKPALTFAKRSMTLDILPGGAMEMSAGNAKYRVSSIYSYPAEPQMKFNRLAAEPDRSGEKSWQVKITPKSKTLTEITAKGSTIHLTRTVEVFSGSRVLVKDTLFNPTKEDQAVVFYHRVIPPVGDKKSHWYLYGQENALSPWDARLASANPTAFLKFGSKALCFVAEDDIFRCHLGAVISERSDGRKNFDFGSNRIGVPAGKSHTIEYTFYMLDGDYFDFINRLRKDWKVPVQTINGPFGSIRTAAHRSEVYKRLAADPEAFRKEFERRNMRILTLNPWFNYWDGDVFSGWNEYKEHMQKVMKIIRAANPEVKFLASLETYTYCVGEAEFPNPAPADFSYDKVTPGTLKRVKESPWNDSATYNKKGNIGLYAMSPLQNRARKSLPLSVHPVMGNHFWKVRMKEFDFLLDEVGMDGIYQDMFGFSAPNNVVFHVWDGFSVSVSPNGKILEKYTQMAPLTAPGRAAWLRKIISKGKIALTNFGAPTTRELQTIAYMNFCEAAGKGVGRQDLKSIPPDSSGCAMNQLSTPLAYGPHRSEEVDAPLLMARVRAYLRYGCLYIHTSVRNSFPEKGPKSGEYGPINHMYPITPIELHRGWVKGKERIVSCVSYKTVWDRKEAPKALRFDAVGRPAEVGNAVKISGKPGAWNIEVKIDDWKEFLIIE